MPAGSGTITWGSLHGRGTLAPAKAHRKEGEAASRGMPRAHWALNKRADEQDIVRVRAHSEDPGARALWDCRRRGIAASQRRLLRFYNMFRRPTKHSCVSPAGLQP